MTSSFPGVRKPAASSSQIEMQTFPFSSSVSLRVYSSTDPRNWKIGDLQKGLILVYNGVETIGEGAGFGLPVLVYSDETCFSGSSRVYVSCDGRSCIVRKEFVMDRVARNTFRNVTLENRAVRGFFRYLASVYQRHSRLRFLTLKGLTGKLDVRTAFLKAVSRGKVVVTYVMDMPRVLVIADLRALEREGLQKIFMLNEQASRFFRRCVDSDGREMVDTGIGAWDEITARWACLKILDGEFGFRLWRVEDSVLRVGREFLKDSLDWVGLDYEIIPEKDVFEYLIEVLGV